MKSLIIFPLLAACLLFFSGISYTVEAQTIRNHGIWKTDGSEQKGLNNLCAAGCPIFHVATGTCTQQECERLCQANAGRNQFSKCLHDVNPQYDVSDCCCAYGASSCN